MREDDEGNVLKLKPSPPSLHTKLERSKSHPKPLVCVERNEGDEVRVRVLVYVLYGGFKFGKP